MIEELLLTAGASGDLYQGRNSSFEQWIDWLCQPLALYDTAEMDFILVHMQMMDQSKSLRSAEPLSS